MHKPPPHQLLPPWCIEALQRAAKTQGEFERTVAIEQATKQIKHDHPTLFKPEQSK